MKTFLLISDPNKSLCGDHKLFKYDFNLKISFVDIKTIKE